MANPRIIAETFELGGRKFYKYLANDSHGQRCRVFMVDDAEVTRDEFQKALVESIRNSNMWDSVYSAVVETYLGMR